MKCKTIGEVTPMIYEDSLVIAFDKKWIDVFGGSIPQFIVRINNNRKLVLESISTIEKFHGDKN